MAMDIHHSIVLDIQENRTCMTFYYLHITEMQTLATSMWWNYSVQEHPYICRTITSLSNKTMLVLQYTGTCRTMLVFQCTGTCRTMLVFQCTGTCRTMLVFNVLVHIELCLYSNVLVHVELCWYSNVLVHVELCWYFNVLGNI